MKFTSLIICYPVKCQLSLSKNVKFWCGTIRVRFLKCQGNIHGLYANVMISLKKWTLFIKRRMNFNSKVVPLALDLLV